MTDGAGRATVPASSSRPHLSLLVPAATFVEVTEQARGSATPRGRLSRRTPSRVAPAMLEDGTPVAMSRLAQALCDCEISRVVLAAGSIPVDLGRTQRLYPAAHRRAVVVRDRHCAWNGCEVPATFSEVHHIRWWVRDRGSTSIENAVLLCSHHHHVVHALDLSITRMAAPRPVVPVPNDPGRPSAVGPRDAPAPGCTELGEPVRYTFRRPDGTVVSSAAGDGSG